MAAKPIMDKRAHTHHAVVQRKKKSVRGFYIFFYFVFFPSILFCICDYGASLIYDVGCIRSLPPPPLSLFFSCSLPILLVVVCFAGVKFMDSRSDGGGCFMHFINMYI